MSAKLSANFWRFGLEPVRFAAVSLISILLPLVSSCTTLGGPPGQVGATEKYQTVPERVAPGTILVDILQGGKPERYWNFEVRPSTGTVTVVRYEVFADREDENIPRTYQQPAGKVDCSENPRAASLDGRLIASCAGRLGGNWNVPDEFFVVDAASSREVFHWKPTNWRRVGGFAWSPNSGSVAFLNRSSYYGKSPLELVAALSGHPVPHDTVYLDVVDVSTGKVTEYLIRKDVISAFDRILRWSQ